MVALASFVSASSKPSTAQHPISLRLKRLNSTSDVKTKPRFFQNILELNPGKSFEVNVDKWNALKQSGLFANLSAKSFFKKDGIAVEVSGIELDNHVRCSPEITLTTSRDNRPEVFGGVSVQSQSKSMEHENHICFLLFS